MRQQVQAEARRSKGGVSKKGRVAGSTQASQRGGRGEQKKKEKRQMAARDPSAQEAQAEPVSPEQAKDPVSNLYGTASGTGGGERQEALTTGLHLLTLGVILLLWLVRGRSVALTPTIWPRAYGLVLARARACARVWTMLGLRGRSFRILPET